jgi:hypothetical protein
VAQPQLLGRLDPSSTGNGGVCASESTSIEVAATSTSPVSSRSLTIPSGRARTVPVTSHDPLAADPVGGLQGVAGLGVGDDLDDPAAVAQVEEGDPTVVAAGVDPAGDGDGLADVVGAEGAGAVAAQGAVGVMLTS